MADEFLVIFVTASSEQEAASISHTLVQEGLVACANIVPGVRSIYRWEGEVKDEGEVLIILKSREGLFERIREMVKSLHSYAVPEVIAIRLDRGDADYLKWIKSVTQGA